MQIEDVAWVGFASWWSAQEQRHFAIRNRVLREVVVDAECIAHEHAVDRDAVLHDLFANRATGEWCEVLEWCWIFGTGNHHYGVCHGALLLELRHNGAHGRELLANCDVDADEALPLLIDDRVNSDGGLAGLAVTDDQLALAAADWNQCVNGLDAGLHWRGDRLAANNARSDALNWARLLRVDWALAVERSTEWVNNTSDQLRADWHLNNPAGRLNGVAFLNGLRIAKEHGADSLFTKVQGHAGNAVWELQKFRRERA